MNRRNFIIRTLSRMAAVVGVLLMPQWFHRYRMAAEAEESPFASAPAGYSGAECQASAWLDAHTGLEMGDIIVVRSDLSPEETQSSPLGQAVCAFRERCGLPYTNVVVIPKENLIHIIRNSRLTDYAEEQQSMEVYEARLHHFARDLAERQRRLIERYGLERYNASAADHQGADLA